MATIERPDHVTAGRGHPRYTRVQVLGLVLGGATITLVSAIALTSDPASLGEILTFFAPVALVLLVAAWLTWRYGTWARVVGIVASLAAGVMLFWTVFGLAAPDSFVDFAAGVGVPLGVLLGIGGGIAAIVASRRGHVHAEAAHGEQLVVRGVIAVVALALAASGILTFLARSSVDPAVASSATVVDMTGFEFEPLQIQVAAADARLVVTNSDAFLHDLTVPALDASVRVTPGSSELLDLSGAASGTYAVYCTLHSDTSEEDPAEAGMAATLIIR